MRPRRSTPTRSCRSRAGRRPPVAPKRFATWFFLAPVPAGEVVVDGGEIVDHRWLAPRDVLEQRDRGEVELAPPTWMTLNALASARRRRRRARRGRGPCVRSSTTRPRWRNLDGGAVAMWAGDAGYEASDADAAGPRHRLWMLDTGWRFEQT